MINAMMSDRIQLINNPKSRNPAKEYPFRRAYLATSHDGKIQRTKMMSRNIIGYAIRRRITTKLPTMKEFFGANDNAANLNVYALILNGIEAPNFGVSPRSLR